MIRLLIWLIRRLGLRELLVWTLLLTMFGGVALGLSDMVRGLDVGLLLPVAGLGLLTGWGLARSPLPGWLAGLVASGLGIEFVFLRVGRLGNPLMVSIQTLPVGLSQIIQASLRGIGYPAQPAWPLAEYGDWRPFLAAFTELWTGIGTLLFRTWEWCMRVAAGQPAFDPVAVALVWSLAVWAVAAWASWWLWRCERPVTAAVPAGVLLGVSVFYVAGNPAFLLPLLGATWLLAVLVSQAARERRWNMTGVDYPGDVGQEVILAGAALSLILVMAAMITPSISINQIVEWSGRLFSRQTDESGPAADWLGLDRLVSEPATLLDRDQVHAPGLPRRHLLGSGPELSQRVVMVIQPQMDTNTDGRLAPGGSVLTPQTPPMRYYWRSLTYDQYTGLGWFTGRTETQEYRAGDLAVFREPFEAPGADSQPVTINLSGRYRVRMEVQAVSNLGELLHVAGDLLTADQDYRIAWRSQQDAFGATLVQANPSQVDLSQERETGQLTGTSMASPIRYQIDSLVPALGEAQLRATGSDYPDWVRNRYLSLPDQVPARVLALARDLTATASTPYARARAIESYLRQFPYTLDLPTPPQDRDVVDYFLFDLRRGYCDYYATAMVVLARAAGLPARLAVGYFSGTFDAVNNRYIVTEADAHSWAEVYFPEYGWIEFEPTGGRPPLERPLDVSINIPPELQAWELSLPPAAASPRPWWLLLPATAVLSGLAALIWSAIDGQRLRRASPQATITILYSRLYRHARQLAIPIQPGNTPYEFVALLADHIRDALGTGRWSPLLTPVAQEARWLADLYVRACYARRSPDTADQTLGIRIWRRLRRRLWLARAFRIATRIGRITSGLSHPTRHARHLPTG